MSEISVQVDRFDAGQEYAALIADDTDGGAAVFFVGRVRAHSEGRQVTGLTVEHYPGMTEQALERIVQEARQRWPLQRVRVVHRVGALALGEPIVFVGALSAHRAAAFSAAEFIMDYLKTRAPFWKKERTPEGDVWVNARDSDQQAAQRW